MILKFISDKPGTYKCNLPIVINNNFEHPYYNIEVVGELLSPEIHFDPDVLIFKPVPLGVEISDQILIKQRGYERFGSHILYNIFNRISIN